MTDSSRDVEATDARHSQRRWCWIWVGGVIGIPILCLAAQVIAGYRIEGWMDAVTGSSTQERVWLFGLTTGPRKTESILERRLTERGIPWSPRWTFLHRTLCSLLMKSYQCGDAPPIYSLNSFLELDPTFPWTDDELREFVRVMQSGSDEEQERAVQAVIERVIAEPLGPSADEEEDG